METTAAQIEQQIYQARLRCSLMARGLWDVITGELHFGQPDDEGRLMRGCQPLAIEDLAHLARVSTEQVRSMLGELSGVGLMDARVNVICSPPLARLCAIRRRVNLRNRRRLERRQEAGGVRSGESWGVTSRPMSRPCHADVTPAPPPVSFSPPTTPSYPSNPLPVSSETLVASATPAGEAGTRKRASKRTRTDSEHAVRREFIDWFVSQAWAAAFEGQAYDFDSVDPQKRGINHSSVWRFLDDDAIGFDLERAKAAAGYFADFCAMTNPRWPCPLQKLSKRAGYYLEMAKRPRSSHVFGSIGAAAQRGQFASDLSALRTESAGDGLPNQRAAAG